MFLRKHTMGLGSSCTRVTIVRFRQIFGPDGFVVVAGGGCSVILGVVLGFFLQNHPWRWCWWWCSVWLLNQGCDSSHVSSSLSGSEAEKTDCTKDQIKSIKAVTFRKICWKNTEKGLFVGINKTCPSSVSDMTLYLSHTALKKDIKVNIPVLVSNWLVRLKERVCPPPPSLYVRPLNLYIFSRW